MTPPCDSCIHGSDKPMDCAKVGMGQYRNLRVVHKVWSAQDRGCSDHTQRPTPVVPAADASDRGLVIGVLLVAATAGALSAFVIGWL